MSNNNLQDLEGEPFCTIYFLVYKNSSDNIPDNKYQMECNMCVMIRGLKVDFADLFGIPAQQQNWYLKDKRTGEWTIELNDEQNLLKCGIGIADLIDLIEIKVTGC